MINLANSYSRSKNYADAENLLRRSLQIMIKQKGTDDQSISFPMLHLAVTLYHLKKDEEAEKLALEVLRIREKAFGKDSLPVGKLSLTSLKTCSGSSYSILLHFIDEHSSPILACTKGGKLSFKFPISFMFFGMKLIFIIY